MRKKLGYIAFFLTCLCFGLVVNMPLTHLLTRIKIPSGVHLSDVDGTILNGQAGRMLVDRVQFDAVNYRVDISCLLGLQICYGLDFDQGKAEVGANLLDQSIELNGVRIDYPLVNLSAYADKLLVQPSGILRLDIPRLTFSDNKIDNINANAVWQQAGIAGESINLGDYELTLNSQKQAYEFTLGDIKAALSVDGRGQLNATGQYTVNISIETPPGLNNPIKTALEFVAKKQGLNRYSVRRTGILPGQYLTRLGFPD